MSTTEREALEQVSRDVMPETWAVIDTMPESIQATYIDALMGILSAALESAGYQRPMSADAAVHLAAEKFPPLRRSNHLGTDASFSEMQTAQDATRYGYAKGLMRE